MSYIVVYLRADGSSGVEECADLDLAVIAAERLRNVDSIERPRIFKTEEVVFDFKPYFRVEVAGAAASPMPASQALSTPAPTASSASRWSETLGQPENVADVPTTYVAPEPPIDEVASYQPAIDDSPVRSSISEPIEPAMDESASIDSMLADSTPAVSPEEAQEYVSPQAPVEHVVEESYVTPEPVGDIPDVTDPIDNTPPRRGLFGR